MSFRHREIPSKSAFCSRFPHWMILTPHVHLSLVFISASQLLRAPKPDLRLLCRRTSGIGFSPGSAARFFFPTASFQLSTFLLTQRSLPHTVLNSWGRKQLLIMQNLLGFKTICITEAVHLKAIPVPPGELLEEVTHFVVQFARWFHITIHSLLTSPLEMLMKISWSSVHGFWIVVPAGDFYFPVCLTTPSSRGLYSSLPTS